MESQVPYLPIDQFESQSQDALIQGFQNEHEDCSEIIVRGERIVKYLQACAGYSPYVELVLQGMGMQKYASLFEEEDISIDVLVCMGDDDLENLGIINAQDRKHILEQLKLFRVKNGDLIQYAKESDFIEIDFQLDHLTIIRNVCKHIRELNSYLAYIQSQLSKNPPHDYLICAFEPCLKYLKFTINHATIQSNRISGLLFGGHEHDMINQALTSLDATLPNFMWEKLRQKKPKKLKKRRVLISVLIGVGIAVAVSVIFKK